MYKLKQFCYSKIIIIIVAFQTTIFISKKTFRIFKVDKLSPILNLEKGKYFYMFTTGKYYTLNMSSFDLIKQSGQNATKTANLPTKIHHKNGK